MSNLSDLLPAGGGQNNTEFTADGAIASGKPVILNSDGTVTEAGMADTVLSDDFIAGSGTTASIARTAVGSQVAWDSADTDKFLHVVEYANVLYGTVGTVSGSGGSTSISMGTPVALVSDGTFYDVLGMVADPFNAGKFLVLGGMSDGGGKSYVISFSGSTSCSIGTGQEFDGSVKKTETTGFYGHLAADPNVENRFVALWTQASGYNGEACVITAASGAGTTMTFGTTMTWQTPSGSYNIVQPRLFSSPADEGEFVVVYRNSTSSTGYGDARCLTVTGTTIAAGDATVFQSNGEVIGETGCFNPDVSGQFWVVFAGYGAGGYTSRSWQAKVGTLNTTTKAISFGSVVTDNLVSSIPTTGQAPADIAAMGTNSGAFLLNYIGTSGGMTGGFIYQIVGTIASGTLTFGTRNETYGGSTENIGSGSAAGVASDPNNLGRCVSAFCNFTEVTNNQTYWVTTVGGTYSATNLTSSNLLGIASAAISDDASGTINTWGSRNEVQSSLTIGSDYYCQADGTITTTSTSPAQLLGKAITATQINIKDYTG